MSNTFSPWSLNLTHKNDTFSLERLVAPSWVSSPSARGTIDILQSSVITLIACIYTALHLNVPNNTGLFSIIWSHLKWAIMSLFAPEIVLYMAFDQLYKVCMLKKQLAKERTRQNRNKKLAISMKYAFFVFMGGIHLNISDIISSPDLDKGAKRKLRCVRKNRSVRLTPHGVLELAKEKHWLYVRDEDINDKSKSDYFQKIIIIMQVAWMIAQCVARKVIGLPLTLLEIHTMVHVVCAIILYLCWLQKPHGVTVPQTFRVPSRWKGKIAIEVQQLFYASSSKSVALYGPQHYPDLNPGSTLEIGPPRAIAPRHGRTSRRGGTPHRHAPGSHTGTAPGIGITAQNYRFEIKPQFLKRWESIFTQIPFNELSEQAAAVNEQAQPPSQESLLHTTPPLRLQNLKVFNIFKSNPDKMIIGKGEGNLNVHFFNKDALTLWTSAMDFVGNHYILAILLSVLSALYGGVHLVAWKLSFPTEIESLAWKISSIIIGMAFPIWYSCSAITKLALSIIPDDKRPRISQIVSVIASWLLWPQIAVYTLARIYIVAESFASLRHVPIGVYHAPNWLQLIPHIG